MEITRRKALYVFLSSILGMLLFTMFHRAVFVIYEILGNFFPVFSLLHLPFRTMAILDFTTFLLALFVGGWYGVWIGMNWYKMIYEDRGVNTWFHGFVPHHWRKTKSKKKNTDLDFINSIAEKAKARSMPKKIVVTSSQTRQTESFRSFRTSKPSVSWNNDDSDTQLEPKTVKKVIKKRSVATPAKKTVRKAVAKKRVTV